MAGQGDARRAHAEGGLHANDVMERLEHYVATSPQRLAMRWLNSRGEVCNSLTYHDVWARSTGIANKLSKLSCLTPDSKVIICYPLGLDFVPAFLALMRLGMTTVSIYPPNPRKLDSELRKLERFAENCGATVALTNRRYKRLITASKLAGKSWPSQITKWVTTDNIAASERERFVANTDNQDAFVQYTSGSTGAPKGVVVTRKNLSHNLACLAETAKLTADTVQIGWLPQYHDYGLVGGFWLNLYVGGSVIAFSPLDFLKDPLMWMEAVDRFKATHIGGPAFSYGLVMKRALANPARTFDLSSIRYVDLGAEPVDPAIAARLTSQLGIPPSSIRATYGLAETTLWVSTAPLFVDEATGIVAVGDLAQCRRFGTRIRLVKEGTEVGESDIGEVYLQGPSVARAYLNQPERTRECFHATLLGHEGQWYRTGDLGFRRGDLLFVCGRIKDLIIINGKNIYPSDLERFAESSFDWARPGSSVAFQWSEASAVLLVEARSRSAAVAEGEVRAMHSAVEAEFGLRLAGLEVYARGQLPKTTSGKIRRSETARLYKQGLLPAPLGAYSTDAAPATTFAELLDKFGVADPGETLLANGIDSLRLLQLRSEAEGLLGWEIPLESLSTVPARDLPAMGKLAEGADDAHTHAARRFQPQHSPPRDRPIRSVVLRLLIECAIVLTTLVVFVGAALPAAFVHRELIARILERHPYAVSPWLVTFENGPGLLLAATPITFTLSLTVAMILVKWIVIGRYRPGAYSLRGPYFYRFLLVDRVVTVWEAFVGRFILDTPYLCLVYMAMGARVSVWTRLGVFFREHDLVEASRSSSINGTLLNRLVDARGITFARTTIPAHSELPSDSLAYPGRESAVVERRSPPAGSIAERVLFLPGVIGLYLACQYGSSFVAQRAGLADRPGRVSVSILAGSMGVALVSILLARLRLTPWLADRLGLTAYGPLAPWLDFSILPACWHRLNGARFGPGSTSNSLHHLAPSKAAFVTIGAGCVMSNAKLRPSPGRPIVVEDGALIGTNSSLRGGVTLGRNAHVFPMSGLEDTSVPADRLYVAPGLVLPARVQTDQRPPSCLRGHELLSLVVRAAVHWLPLAALIAGVVVLGETLTELDAVRALPLPAQVGLVMGCLVVTGGSAMTALYVLLARAAIPGTALSRPTPSLWLDLQGAHYAQSTAMQAYVWPFCSGTFVLNLHLRLAGASLALLDTMVIEAYIHDPRLARFGRGAVADRAAHINGHRFSYGETEYAPVTLGPGASVHPLAAVQGGDELEANATLTGRSCFLGPRKAPETMHEALLLDAGGEAAPQVVVYSGHPARRVVHQSEQRSPRFLPNTADSTAMLLDL